MLPAETKQSLQEECDALGESIDQMYATSGAKQQEIIAAFQQQHQATIENLDNTLSSYGLTREHSRALTLTACLTRDFNKVGDDNIPTKNRYWNMATQQAVGYLNTTAVGTLSQQQNMPTDTGLYQPNEGYQQRYQEKVIAEWLEPIHDMQDQLLLQPDNLIQTLTTKKQILVLPAACRDKEQADSILAFMQNPVITNHYSDHDTTMLSGIAGNDLVLETLFDNQIAQENPDWSGVQDTLFHVIQGCTTSTAHKLIAILHDKHPETLTTPNDEGRTPLHLAIEHDRTDIFFQLIDRLLATNNHQALVAQDLDGNSPLHTAMWHRKNDIANALIDVLAEKNPRALATKNNAETTPLHEAIDSEKSDVAIKLIDILEEKNPLNLPEKDGFLTALALTIKNRQADIANHLID